MAILAFSAYLKSIFQDMETYGSPSIPYPNHMVSKGQQHLPSILPHSVTAPRPEPSFEGREIYLRLQS